MNSISKRTRRSFIRLAGSALSAGGLFKIFGQEKADSSAAAAQTAPPAAPAVKKHKVAIALGKLKKIEKPGDGIILELKGRKVLLLRRSDSEISALDTECRHKKCPVLFESGWGEIRCKCHGSVYNLAGEVQKGPSTANLALYTTEIKDGKLIITLEIPI